MSLHHHPDRAVAGGALAREHRAESVSMRSVLFPESVAVVGASRRADSIGHHLLPNILAAGFTGAVHAVNREAMEVLGLPAHARVGDIGRTGRPRGGRGARRGGARRRADCAGAGVKALLVVSAGFAEAGPEGEERQRELLRTARGTGMRVIGPNSFGVINTDPDVRLNASLAPELPPPGRLGLFSQSGALGIAVLASAARRGLGISVFASAGNRVDVSGNDFMQYWIDDDDTDAVGLYLESMGNPRKFSRIARRLASTKPVIVVKSGVSSYGVPPGHRARATTGAARGVRRDAAPGRGDPGRERPPDVRRRPAGRAPAAAAGQPGGHRRQLRRPRRADRRGLRQLGPRGRPRAGVAAERGRRRASSPRRCADAFADPRSTASSPASSRRW